MKNTPETLAPPREKAKRPFGVTLVTLGVLSITSLNLLRLGLSIFQWQFLSELKAASPMYIALTGLLWAGVGGAWLWGLWRRLYWAPAFTRQAVLIYTLFTWLERIFLRHWQAGQPIPPNWPFTIAWNILILLFVFWVFSKKDAKAFFGEKHEPKF